MKILLVSSEITPYAKTGGLADVSAALARFLGRKRHEVRLVMPMYARVREGGFETEPVAGLQDLRMRLGAHTHWFSVSSARLPDSRVEVLFVRCPALYDRPGIYTQDPDEHLRFALLSRAAIELCQWLQWAPDVIHCNDWHTALVPLYLRTRYSWDQLLAGTRTVLTLHNLGYQGVFGADAIEDLGLGEERRFLHQEDLRDGKVNFLKTGLLYAGALTTVSRTYAREIQTAESGMGLEGLLRQRADSLFGIVNGVDYQEWNPETDPRIPQRYSAEDPSGKAASKLALMQELGLSHDARAPVVGLVSRLTWQKGFELLPEVLPDLLGREDLRVVVLGNGEERYERFFEQLQRSHPGRVAFRTGFRDDLAHLIEAGSDLFLMPSRYEPCGLNQMYSLRYGTVPVVRRTGGLADTVQAWDPAARTGTGFLFDEFSAGALRGALGRAFAAWRDPAGWARLMANGMAMDFSWERQGREYLELYRKLLEPVGA